MKITNKYNLPEEIVTRITESLTSDPYDREGEEGISFRTTELIGSPLPSTLMRKYRDSDKLVVDVSDYMYIIYGTVLHEMLDKTANTQPGVKKEQRMSLSMTVLGKEVTVHGTADHIRITDDFIDIFDNKVTGMFNATSDPKDDYIAQGNIYGHMARILDGNETKPLNIKNRLFLRDWNVFKAMQGYNTPKCAYAELDLPAWDYDTTKLFIGARIKDHLQNPERLCSALERNFGKPAVTCAVMKKGGKRSAKNCITQAEAVKFINTKKDPQNYFVEPRQDGDMKCKHYCQVSSVCPYAIKEGYNN